MTVLAVDRLHASYHVASPASAARLDDALRQVVSEGLARELLGRDLSSAHAVCVRDVALSVELDVRRPAEDVARVWAAAIVGAVERRLADVDDEVVVFRREVDLLVDLIRSVAADDRARVWAWHQTALLDARITWPGADDVTAALLRRPELVPAVLGATGGSVGAVLTPEGWLRLARAVRPLIEAAAVSPSATSPGVTTERGASPGRTTSVHHSEPVDHRPVSGTGAAAAGARSSVPEAAWAAAGHGELRRALAVLALACVDPARCRHAGAIDQVASDDHRAVDGGQPEAGLAADARAEHDPAGRDVHGPLTRPGGGVEPPQRRADAAPSEVASLGDVVDDTPAGEPVTSALGGLFFLVHAITELDLAVEVNRGPLQVMEPRHCLARVVASAAGVAVDDPSTLAVTGWRRIDPVDPLHDPLEPDQAAAVAALGRRLRDRVLERLGQLEDDLDWVWARPVVIDARPGWVEATFALDDVDLRLRIAGLDLDPGYVWWLGAVVRFRYV